MGLLGLRVTGECVDDLGPIGPIEHSRDDSIADKLQNLAVECADIDEGRRESLIHDRTMTYFS